MVVRRQKARPARGRGCDAGARICAFAATVLSWATPYLSWATPVFAEPADANAESKLDQADHTEPGAESTSSDSAAPVDGVTESPAESASPPVASESTAPLGDADSPNGSSAPPPGSPASAPPPVVAADPNWYRRDSLDNDQAEPHDREPEDTVDVGLGFQLFNPRGKVMTGPTLRVGKNLVWFAIEFSPIWLIEESPDFADSFLGNQSGFHLELAPLRTPHFELLAGAGLDVYHLWGIHGDEALFALTLKVHAQFRINQSASVFATLRGYPLSSNGLELGRDRRGDMIAPVLGSVGFEWRWQ